MQRSKDFNIISNLIDYLQKSPQILNKHFISPSIKIIFCVKKIFTEFYRIKVKEKKDQKK